MYLDFEWWCVHFVLGKLLTLCGRKLLALWVALWKTLWVTKYLGLLWWTGYTLGIPPWRCYFRKDLENSFLWYSKATISAQCQSAGPKSFVNGWTLSSHIVDGYGDRMDSGMFPTLLVDGRHGELWMTLHQIGKFQIVTKKLSRAVCTKCSLLKKGWV